MYEPNITLEGISDGSALKKCKEIAQEIVKGNYEILNVVISLKECLTHPEPLYRGGGLSLLTNVMKELPKTLLNSRELSQLSDYICERLKDHIALASANLQAILALFSMDNLNSDCVKKLLDLLFDNIPCQQQDKKDRLAYMTIIRLSCTKYPKVIQEMGDEMLKCFTESVDGERDPQVLVLNFRSFIELSKLLPNVPITEETFEIFGVYFPVDFSAPVEADKPYTRDNLSKLLKKCLLSYKAFAKYAIPLVLEKLDSDFEIAKLDSLEFLLDSCDIYKDSDFKPHIHELTKLLRLEILKGRESKTCKLSLILLRRLSGLLNESLNDFVDIVSNFCLIFLQDDSMTQQHLIAIYVLYATALGSKSACERILNRVIPIIMGKNVTINAASQMCILLQSRVKTQAELESKIETDFLSWFAKRTANDIKISIIMTNCMIMVDKNLHLIKENIYDIILQGINNGAELIPYCLNIMQQMAKKDENFAETFIPHLINELSENKIEVLIRLMFVPDISKTIFQCFIDHLKSPQIYQQMLKKFLHVYENEKDSRIKSSTLKTLVEQFDFHTCLEECLQNPDVTINEDLFFTISNIFVILSEQFSSKDMKNVLNKNRCAMWDCKILAMYNGLICRSNKNDLQISYISELIACLIKSSLSSNAAERFFSNLTIYNLINKTKDIEPLLVILSNELNCDNVDNNLILKLECNAWLIKGLLLRNDKRFQDWLLKFANSEYLLLIYKILCSECPIYDGHISILYKQKLFVTTEILFRSENAKEDTKLFVYNLLMDYAPKSVLHMHKDFLNLVLVESIRSANNELQWISLYNIKNILEASSEENSLCLSLCENIDKVLPKILDLLTTSDQQENKKMALLIISYYANAKQFLIKLIQYKQQVLQCLKKCLSNQSRMLRFIVQKSIDKWKNIDCE